MRKIVNKYLHCYNLTGEELLELSNLYIGGTLITQAVSDVHELIENSNNFIGVTLSAAGDAAILLYRPKQPLNVYEIKE